MHRSILYSLSLFLLLSGCQSASPVKSQTESFRDVEEALGSVAGAVRGRELTEAELKELKHQIRHDKEAQSAIRTIGESISGQDRIIKYCPLTGKRFSSNVEICPTHNVKLEVLE